LAASRRDAAFLDGEPRLTSETAEPREADPIGDMLGVEGIAPREAEPMGGVMLETEPAPTKAGPKEADPIGDRFGEATGDRFGEDALLGDSAITWLWRGERAMYFAMCPCGAGASKVAVVKLVCARRSAGKWIVLAPAFGVHIGDFGDGLGL